MDNLEKFMEEDFCLDAEEGRTLDYEALGFEKKQVLIISGLSGAGKSTVLRSLEDLGFFCVDNLPTPLFSTFLNFVFKTHTGVSKVALGIDVRGGTFLQGFVEELKLLREISLKGANIKIVFLDSLDETIIKRFQETRRMHPLARDISMCEAIKKERSILEPIKKLSNEIHLTDESTVHDLRRWVIKKFSRGLVQELVVNIISFGFKYGVPIESNIVYDVRFLPNPYFVADLKKLNGQDKAVQNYLFAKEEVRLYWEKLESFLRYTLDCYYREGRFFANVSIGCTGGKHRSVSFVEKLAKQNWDNIKFVANHRDLGKE